MTKTILTTIASSVFAFSALCGANEDLVNACKQGDAAAAKKAIDSGADVNFLDENGNTPICSAFLWADVTKVLIDAGADVNGGNYPAIINAGNNYSVEVMDLLIAAGADVNKPGKLDPGAGLRKMLEDEKAKGKKANKTLIDAWEGVLKTMQPVNVTALQQTVQQSNCVPCLEKLVANGAKAEITDGNIWHTFAVFSMTPEDRKKAFASGVTAMEGFGYKVPEWWANLPDNINGTPQQMAALLAKTGEDVNAKNSAELTPLLSALGTQKIDAAKGIIAVGGDVTYFPKDNAKDAVSHAAEIGDLELMKMIVENGADVNHETWDLDQETGSFCKGFTPLTRAAIYDNYDCAKYLIENGAKIKEGVSGYFSKPARAGFGKGPLLTNLAGQQLYCRFKLQNKMAIYFAIENGNLEMVKLLAENFGWYQNHSMEMKPQTANLDNTSALKGACEIAGGKFTPSRYAKTLEQKEIQKYLESEGK